MSRPIIDYPSRVCSSRRRICCHSYPAASVTMSARACSTTGYSFLASDQMFNDVRRDSAPTNVFRSISRSSSLSNLSRLVSRLRYLFLTFRSPVFTCSVRCLYVTFKPPECPCFLPLVPSKGRDCHTPRRHVIPPQWCVLSASSASSTPDHYVLSN